MPALAKHVKRCSTASRQRKCSCLRATSGLPGAGVPKGGVRPVAHSTALDTPQVHLDHQASTDVDGGKLPYFMNMFHSTVARGVALHQSEPGPVWDSSGPDLKQIDGPETVLRKIVYTLANAAAADLCDSPGDWYGAMSPVALIGAGPITVRRPEAFSTAYTRHFAGAARLAEQVTDQAALVASVLSALVGIPSEHFTADEETASIVPASREVRWAGVGTQSTAGLLEAVAVDG